jgi:hypothetical protein
MENSGTAIAPGPPDPVRRRFGDVPGKLMEDSGTAVAFATALPTMGRMLFDYALPASRRYMGP